MNNSVAFRCQNLLAAIAITLGGGGCTFDFNQLRSLAAKDAGGLNDSAVDGGATLDGSAAYDSGAAPEAGAGVDAAVGDGRALDGWAAPDAGAAPEAGFGVDAASEDGNSRDGFAFYDSGAASEVGGGVDAVGGSVGTGGTGGSGEAGLPDARDGQLDLPIGGADGGAIGGSGGSGDAGMADLPDGQPDVPTGGTDGGVGTGGNPGTGGNLGTGGTTSAGGTTTAGGTTSAGGSGTGGGCGSCISGQRCSGSVCVCDGTSCPSGCCNGAACEAYANQTALMCGTAGVTCGICTGSGATCQNGQCCAAGLFLCGGTCINQQTDSSNCGGCGHACVLGQHCSGGTCVCDGTSCPSGCCNGGTTCESQSVSYCGTAGGTCATCTGGQTCQSGTCACPTNLPSWCNGTCVNQQNDSANCGACSHACGAGSSCAAGMCQAATLTSGINNPTALDVGGGYAYFGTTSADVATVGRCPDTGCPGTPDYLVSGFSTVVAVEAGTGRFFFAGIRAAGTNYDHVHVCTSDGCPVVPTTISISGGYSYITGMHRDDQRVYWWGDNNGLAFVEYCPLTGCTGSDSTRVYNVKPDSVSALTSGAGDIYLAATISSVVGLYRCAGGDCTNARTSVLASESADQMAYDQGELFWLHSTIGYDLYHCTASSCTRSSFFNDLDTPQRFAVDATGVYFSTYSGLILACRRSGCVGLPKQIGSVTGKVVALVLDGNFVYWLTDDNGTGILQRVAKPVL